MLKDGEGRTAAVLFEQMHHVAIIVSDYRRAREFYVEKLGFPVLPFRTRKLSSLLPKILVWRRTGKIGSAYTKRTDYSVRFF